MIAALRFGRDGRGHFEPVPNVRTAAVCAVANSARDRLSELLERPIVIDVFEPVVVPSASQKAVFADALVFLAHGRRSDLLVAFRARDARRIAAAAFGEEGSATAKAPLSAMEERVLERVGFEIARICAPLCGEVTSFARAGGRIEDYACAAYFELRIGSPVDAVIGLALATDPAPTPDVRLSAAALGRVPINVRARLARTRMTAGAIATLRAGSIVRFDARLDDPSELYAGTVRLATGACGVAGDVRAFSVSERTTGGIKP